MLLVSKKLVFLLEMLFVDLLHTRYSVWTCLILSIAFCAWATSQNSIFKLENLDVSNSVWVTMPEALTFGFRFSTSIEWNCSCDGQSSSFCLKKLVHESKADNWWARLNQFHEKQGLQGCSGVKQVSFLTRGSCVWTSETLFATNIVHIQGIAPQQCSTIVESIFPASSVPFHFFDLRASKSALRSLMTKCAPPNSSRSTLIVFTGASLVYANTRLRQICSLELMQT